MQDFTLLQHHGKPTGENYVDAIVSDAKDARNRNMDHRSYQEKAIRFCLRISSSSSSFDLCMTSSKPLQMT
jgi:hypothetical protein